MEEQKTKTKRKHRGRHRSAVLEFKKRLGSKFKLLDKTFWVQPGDTYGFIAMFAANDRIQALAFYPKDNKGGASVICDPAYKKYDLELRAQYDKLRKELGVGRKPQSKKPPTESQIG